MDKRLINSTRDIQGWVLKSQLSYGEIDAERLDYLNNRADTLSKKYHIVLGWVHDQNTCTAVFAPDMNLVDPKLNPSLLIGISAALQAIPGMSLSTFRLFEILETICGSSWLDVMETLVWMANNNLVTIDLFHPSPVNKTLVISASLPVRMPSW